MDFMPTLPLLLALVVVVPPSALLFSWTPIGRALTQRLKGQSVNDTVKLDEVHSAMFELHGMMARVAADVEDLQDRVAFAERLLTAGSENEKELTPV